MKKLLGLVTMLALTCGVVGQGDVVFLNFDGAGVNALVNDENGNLCDTSYMGQLYAGQDANSLAPVGVAVSFVGGGIIAGGTVTVPTVGDVAGGPAVIQLRAWASASGSSYEAAVANVGIVGESNVINLGSTGSATASPPTPPVPLTGLQTFDLAVVPEPSTWALLALGVGALALRRRK